MSIQNRRISTETYDPKQRIVGGIVLFLIMLLIYSLLKLLLGISTPPEGTYTLRAPLPDEVALMANQNGTGTPSLTTSAANQGGRPLPTGFVFLNIDGNPMVGSGNTASGQPYTPSESSISSSNLPLNGPYWIVQASSFREESRAERLVEQLKDKGLDAEIHKIGNWYTVRLAAQADREGAERQLRQLKNLMNLKGLIKKID